MNKIIVLIALFFGLFSIESMAMAPDLFQIDVGKTSVKLFFSPLPDTDKFYVSFSEKPSATEHGEIVRLSKEGVQSENIYFLKPNTTYYFKIRGEYENIAGEWSNVMKVTTRSTNPKKPVSVYKYLSSNKNALNNRALVTGTPVVTILAKPTPTLLPKVTPVITVTSPSPTTAKTCFLWWCK